MNKLTLFLEKEEFTNNIKICFINGIILSVFNTFVNIIFIRIYFMLKFLLYCFKKRVLIYIFISSYERLYKYTSIGVI